MKRIFTTLQHHYKQVFSKPGHRIQDDLNMYLDSMCEEHMTWQGAKDEEKLQRKRSQEEKDEKTSYLSQQGVAGISVHIYFDIVHSLHLIYVYVCSLYY
jgi:hypothetical protein